MQSPAWRVPLVGKEHSGADRGRVEGNIVQQFTLGMVMTGQLSPVHGRPVKSMYCESRHSPPSSPRVSANSLSSVGRPASADTGRMMDWQRNSSLRPVHGHSTPTISHRLSLSVFPNHPTPNSTGVVHSSSQMASPQVLGSRTCSPAMSRRSSAPGTPRLQPPRVQLDGKSSASRAAVRQASSAVAAADLKRAPEIRSKLGVSIKSVDPHAEGLTNESVQIRKTVEEHLSLQDLEIAVIRDHFDELSKNVDLKMAGILQHLTQELKKETDDRVRDVERLWTIIAGADAMREAGEQTMQLPPADNLQEEQQTLKSTHLANGRQDELMRSCLASPGVHSRLEYMIAEMGQELQQLREDCMESIMQSTSDTAVRLSRMENWIGQLRCEGERDSPGVFAAQQVVCDKPAADAATQILIGKGETSASDVSNVRNLCDMVQGVSGALSDLSRNVDIAWKQAQSQVEATKLHAEQLHRQIRDDGELDLAADVPQHAASPRAA